MSAMIQIRHVPDEVHRKLKARAALAGLSLSEYLLRNITRLAETPTLDEMRARLSARKPVILSKPVVETLREERERR